MTAMTASVLETKAGRPEAVAPAPGGPTPIGSKALDAARRAIAAAHLAQAVGPAADTLGWEDLLSWPDWALTAPAAADALALHLAAWSQAEGLRRSIDGRVLQEAVRLLGPAALAAVLDTRDADGPLRSAALPAPDQLAAAWCKRGRGLLLATVQGSGLQQAVAARLGWEAEPASIDSEAARALLRQVQAMPIAADEVATA
jgi:hypothetical protein